MREAIKSGLPWWKCGWYGALALSITTLIKVIVMITTLPRISFREFAGFAAFVFAAGFAAGVSFWVVRRLIRKPAWLAEMIAGFVVMEVFFFCCAAMFARLARRQVLGRVSDVHIWRSCWSLWWTVDWPRRA